MKILVVDKDPLTAQFIKAKLEPLGHQVTAETSKNEAAKNCQSNHYDIVMLDPSPLTSPRTLILDIRRAAMNYPYTILLSQSVISQEDALKFGVNDVLAKPLNPEDLDQKIQNAEFFSKLVKRMGDDSEDFPRAGGIIAKSAYNQLFLSAIDRSHRYGESTYLIFISLSNYSDIYATEGPYAADYAVAKLSQYLVTLRRQSDIVGQTANNEYSLILQRPMYETEPVDAANRFTESLMSYEGFKTLDTKNIEISIKLVNIPSGTRPVENVFRPLDEMI
jgi:CheY-like chemotaxis protein